MSEVIIKIKNLSKQYQLGKISTRMLSADISSVFAKIMNKADLAIGGGGIMIWERCSLGLPSIVSIIAKNQENSVSAAAKFGCIKNLGKSGKLLPKDYFDAIINFNSKELIQMQKNCMKLIDGKGTERVVKQISLL